MYFFHIGSVDSFERKMEEAQEALGITLGEEVGARPAGLHVIELHVDGGTAEPV